MASRQDIRFNIFNQSIEFVQDAAKAFPVVEICCSIDAFAIGVAVQALNLSEFYRHSSCKVVVKKTNGAVSKKPMARVPLAHTKKCPFVVSSCVDVGTLLSFQNCEKVRRCHPHWSIQGSSSCSPCVAPSKNAAFWKSSANHGKICCAASLIIKTLVWPAKSVQVQFCGTQISAKCKNWAQSKPSLNNFLNIFLPSPMVYNFQLRRFAAAILHGAQLLPQCYKGCPVN